MTNRNNRSRRQRRQLNPNQMQLIVRPKQKSNRNQSRQQNMMMPQNFRNRQNNGNLNQMFDQFSNMQMSSNSLVPMPAMSMGMQGGRSTQLRRSRRAQGSLSQFTISQIDPFAPEAEGVKVPDDATAPSCVAFSRDIQTINTGTTIGGGGVAVRYHPGNTFVVPVPVTSTTWTWPAAHAGFGTSNQGALNTNFNAIRCVSYGIKICTRQAVLNASGFVHIALVPEVLDETTWEYPTSVTAMEYAPYYRRIPLADLVRDEIIVPGRYTDHTAFRYVDSSGSDTSGASGTFPTTGWLAIIVWVEGPVAVTNALDVDIIHNWEALASSSTGAGTNGVLQITPPAPYSPGILAATDYTVQNSEPVRVIAENQDDTPDFWDGVGNLFNTGIKVAQGLVPIFNTVSKLFF